MTAKEFFEIQKDAASAKKLLSAMSLVEKYTIAKEYGVTDSIDTLREEMELRKAATGELSDDDLEEVAGGFTYKKVYDEWANA